MGKLNLLLPMAAFFGLALLGMSWSPEPQRGWILLRILLPLALLPMLFFRQPGERPPAYFNRWLVPALVAGNLCAATLCIARALIRYGQSSDASVLSYHELVHWLGLHPAYSVFYAGSAVLLLLGGRREALIAAPWRFAVFSALIAWMFLLNSRGALLAFAAVFPLYLAVQRQKGAPWRELGLQVALILVLGLSLTAGLPRNRERAASMLQTRESSIEQGSAGLRLNIWKAAVSALREQLPWGTGTGAVQPALHRQYTINGFTQGRDAAFNAHNQYLQSAIMLGLPGLLALAALLGWPAWQCWRAGYPERSAVLLFFALAFSSESMLERQMGVLPLAVLCAVFSIPSPPPKSSA
jgi:O-antigen ligase